MLSALPSNQRGDRADVPRLFDVATSRRRVRHPRGAHGAIRITAGAALVAAAALTAAPARGATTANWLGASDGNWIDPTRWSTNPAYPNNGTPAGVTCDARIAAA